MKKIFAVLIVSVLTLLSSCQKEKIRPIQNITEVNSEFDKLTSENWQSYFEVDTVKIHCPDNILMSHIVNSSYISKNGYIYLRDDQHFIYKFDAEGNFVNRLDKVGRGPGEYRYIGEFAIDINDNVYVANLFNGDILIYNNKLEFKRKIKYTPYIDFKTFCLDSLNNIILQKPYDLQTKPVHFLNSNGAVKWISGKIDSLVLMNQSTFPRAGGKVYSDGEIVYYSHITYYKIFRISYDGTEYLPIEPDVSHFVMMDDSGNEFGHNISRMMGFMKMGNLFFLHLHYPAKNLSERNLSRYDIIDINGRLLAKDIVTRRNARFSKCYGNKFMEVYYSDKNITQNIELFVVTYKLKKKYE